MAKGSSYLVQGREVRVGKKYYLGLKDGSLVLFSL